MASVKARCAPVALKLLQAHTWLLALFACGVFLLMSALCPRTFPTARNLSSMAFQCPELGLLSLAVALTLISGGIDLSVVSTANLSALLAAYLLTAKSSGTAGEGLVVAAALGVIFASGALCGALNGFLVARVGITPILATLGTMQLYFGVALVLSKGTSVYGFPSSFLALGNESVVGVPIPFVIFAGEALAVAVLLGRTRFGKSLILIGTNRRAAFFCALSVRKILFSTYVLSGLLASTAGLLIAARANSAKADYGTSYLLQAVVVPILGGVHPAGGKGTAAGVVLALLSLQFLASGFNMLRLSMYASQVAWGLFLLGVMILGSLSERFFTASGASR